jgi:hypothetical protein
MLSFCRSTAARLSAAVSCPMQRNMFMRFPIPRQGRPPWRPRD